MTAASATGVADDAAVAALLGDAGDKGGAA